MQLHYNILWIDNDLPDYEERGAVTNLEKFLLDLGFEPYIVALYDQSKLVEHLNQTKFDLIISDYQLGDTTGDKIIRNIREKKCMTEILFYSARTDFISNKEVQDQLKFIDRISFHQGRDTLIPKIETLVELTLDKLLDINATRGIITSATSELDVTIEELTHIIINKFDDSKVFSDKIIQNYIKHLQDEPLKFSELYTNKGFEYSYKSINAFRKWRILRELLKEYNTNSSEPISSFLKNNKTYSDQVIKIRNQFAHAKAEEPIAGKLVLKGKYEGEDFEFDTNTCITIRKNIISHKKNFDSIISYFALSNT